MVHVRLIPAIMVSSVSPLSPFLPPTSHLSPPTSHLMCISGLAAISAGSLPGSGAPSTALRVQDRAHAEPGRGGVRQHAVLLGGLRFEPTLGRPQH